MNVKYLALAGAASLLMTGVAYAQSTSSPAPAPAYPSTGGSVTATTPSTDTTVTGTTSSSSGVVTSSTTTSADVAGQNASVTTTLTTNGPVADTPENRRKYGGPMSHAGKHTAPKGN